MTKFQITFDVKMYKFFEQPQKKSFDVSWITTVLKTQPECASQLPWSAGVVEKYVKSKYRTSLSHEHLKSVLIIGTTKSEPNVEEILSAKQLQTWQCWACSWIKYFCSIQTLMKILFLWGEQLNLHVFTFKYSSPQCLLTLNHSL
jgi:hypothetical protein